MRGSHVVGIMLMLFVIVACGEKVTSICGGTGACCAIGYNDNGKNVYTVFQCVAKDKCGPDCQAKYQGQTSCPYADADEGQCGVQKKTVWIWESDFWDSQAATATAAKPADEFGAKAADIKAAALDRNSPTLCRDACAEGSATSCPTVMVPNSVSLGLLTTMSQIADEGDLTDRLIPISQVEKNFGVEGGLAACPRGDLLVRNGQLLNSGERCDAEIDPMADSRIEATLFTDPVVIADLLKNPGMLTFAEDAKGFGLDFVRDDFDTLFGGSLSTAAVARKTSIAVTMKRPAGEDQPCVAVEGISTRASSFHSVAKLLSLKPDIMTSAMDVVSSAVPSTDASDTETDVAAETKSLLPLTSEYRRLLSDGDPATASRLKSSNFPVTTDEGEFVISLPQALLFMDLEICNRQLSGKTSSEIVEMLPLLRPDVEMPASDMEAREQLAGELLLCRFAYESLPSELKAAMSKAAPDVR